MGKEDAVGPTNRVESHQANKATSSALKNPNLLKNDTNTNPQEIRKTPRSTTISAMLRAVCVSEERTNSE